MIDLDATIVAALKADATLVAALGGQRFYNVKAPNAGEFPRLSFFCLANSIGLGADNVEFLADISYQFDIWSLTSWEVTIAQRVEAVLSSLGFVRDNLVRVYEDDTGIYHAVLTATALKKAI